MICWYVDRLVCCKLKSWTTWISRSAFLLCLSFQLKTQMENFLFGRIFCPAQKLYFSSSLSFQICTSSVFNYAAPSGRTVTGFWYKTCKIVPFARTLSISSSNDFQWLMIANNSRGWGRYWHESGGARSNTDSITPYPHYRGCSDITLKSGVMMRSLTCRTHQTPPLRPALQSKIQWQSPKRWKQYRSHHTPLDMKGTINIYWCEIMIINPPTWPSSAISRVSSRLPIREIVSSAMSVMFEKIPSNSWLVVRSN